MFPELLNRKNQELLKDNSAKIPPESLLREGDETVEPSLSEKSTALLRFLKDTATLRRKRIPAYGATDKLLWFGEVPKDRPECRSAFLADNPAEFPDLWLEVREIPPSELLLVFDRINSSSLMPLQNGEAESRALLDHYGFTRLTEVRRRYLSKILGIYRRQSHGTVPSMNDDQVRTI